MVSIAEFNDPRLVAVYDCVNAYGPGEQPDFYEQLAAEVAPATIVELGCGTGMVACALAEAGHRVIGVEPSAAMLDQARGKPCAGRVRWVQGDATDIGALDADLAIMSGHVAQFFVIDEEWSAALAGLHGALRRGGRLAFESRNPAAKAWLGWSHGVRRSVLDPVAGRVDWWTSVQDARDGIVSYSIHYAFATSGEELVSQARLRFRSEAELVRSLIEMGFDVEHTFGDWAGGPVEPGSPELVVVARRR